MAESLKAFVVAPGTGELVRGPVGGPTTIKADTASTGGSFTFLENLIPPGQGPPLHSHAREDEMWFVLDGRFRFLADGEMLDADEGSFVFVPRRTAHCFQNVGATAARILVMFTPSGMERFFRAHAALPDGPVDEEAYRRIAAESWMDVMGPPLAVSHPR